MGFTLEQVVQRMSHSEVSALADAIEASGDAVAELRDIAERKHRNAIWDGRAYIRPDVAQEMAAIEAITLGLNWSKSAKAARAMSRGTKR